MKKTTLSTISIFLSLLFILSLASCKDKMDTEALWANASYTEDTTVGEGTKTVMFKIECGDKSVTVTLKTDKNTLGDAMYAAGLINDASFFNVLNGIEASWEKDNAYWAFYYGQSETVANHGVNDAKINGGESFRFVYTK